MAFVFGLQTLQLKDFSKIYQLRGLKPKYKGHPNFYQCCDFMKRVYLLYVCESRGLIKPRDMVEYIGYTLNAFQHCSMKVMKESPIIYRLIFQKIRKFQGFIQLN